MTNTLNGNCMYLQERLERGRQGRITVKQAAYEVIAEAYQLMAMHVEFGQHLADQATGALFYALKVRKP